MEGGRHGKATLLNIHTPNIKLTGKSNTCKVWFGLESKKRARCEEIDSDDDDDRLALESLQEGNDQWRYLKKRKLNMQTVEQPSEDEDDLSMYRNIRLGRSGVTKSTKDKILEELRTTFPELNLDTLTNFLEKSNGDIRKTIASLRVAISIYETMTKDTSTFTTSQEIAKLDKEVTSRSVQDAHGSVLDPSERVLESIEICAEKPENGSFETYDSDDYWHSPPLLPLSLSLSESPPPLWPDNGSYPSTASSTPSPCSGPETQPSPPKHDSRKLKRSQKTQASQGDAVLIDFLGGHSYTEVVRTVREDALNYNSSDNEALPTTPTSPVLRVVEDDSDESVTHIQSTRYKGSAHILSTALKRMPLT